MIDFWVTLELSRMGERELPEELTRMLKAMCPDTDLEVFIPAVSFYRRDHAVTVCVLEGYAFVRAGLPASFYFDFESSPFISRVLSRDERKGRFLQYVPDEDIVQLKHKLAIQSVREIKIGDRVEISDGAYRNLSGVVEGMSPDKTKAYITVEGLVSLETAVELPLQFIKKVNLTTDQV